MARNDRPELSSDDGSDSGEWTSADWRRLRERAVHWHPPHRPTVVVSPHPDDETLSSGGLVALQRSRGLPVTVIAVTDGGAAYADADPPVDPTLLSARRRREQLDALNELGVASLDVVRLGLPDGDVAAHEAAVVDVLRRHLDRRCLLVATWSRDRHPDHEATGRAAAIAANDRGAEMVSSMFWCWHGPVPEGDHLLLRLDLTAEQRRRKQRALLHHQSQLLPMYAESPVLDARSLRPTLDDSEFFVVGS